MILKERNICQSLKVVYLGTGDLDYLLAYGLKSLFYFSWAHVLYMVQKSMLHAVAPHIFFFKIHRSANKGNSGNCLSKV